MAKPFISVIIPCYNEERFLEETLQSLSNQSYTSFEAIIVNDGSTDSTGTIIKNFSGIKNLKLITQSNQGLSVARNNAIKKSTGKIITFLDADDLYEKDYLLKVSKFHKANPTIHTAAFSRVMYIDENSQLLYPYSFGYPYKLTLDKFIDCPLLPVAVSLKKEAICKFGLFNAKTTIAEDYEFWINLALKGLTFSPCPNNLVYYRYRSSSMMYNGMNKYNEKFQDLQNKVTKKVNPNLISNAKKIINKRTLTAEILRSVNNTHTHSNVDFSLFTNEEITEIFVHAFTRAYLKPWDEWVLSEKNQYEKILTFFNLDKSKAQNILERIVSYNSFISSEKTERIRQQLKSILNNTPKVGIFGAGRQAYKLLPALENFGEKIVFIDDCPLAKLGKYKVTTLQNSSDIKVIVLSSDNYQDSIVKRIRSERPDLLIMKFSTSDSAICIT